MGADLSKLHRIFQARAMSKLALRENPMGMARLHSQHSLSLMSFSLLLSLCEAEWALGEAHA